MVVSPTHDETHGYYWGKFAADPQPQIVMIHVDATV